MSDPDVASAEQPLPGEGLRPRPSPLRLWGFLVTILGGTLLGVGAILSWASVEIGSVGGAFPAEPVPGIDVLAGKIALGAAILALLGIPAMRQALTHRGRRAWAIAIIILGLVGGGLALWSGLAPDTRLDDGVNQALEDAAQPIADQTGLPVDQVVERLQEVAVTTVTVEPGLWLTVAGGALAVAGGVLGLVWASNAPLPATREQDQHGSSPEGGAEATSGMPPTR
ncbi:MAG: hypothetical protein WD206_00740 [Actinomycetota bacterium]